MRDEPRRWGATLLLALVGVLLVLLAGRLRGWPPPIVAEDLSQHRLDTALPALREGVTVRQSFTPRQAGLREIELLLARHDPDDPGGTLRLRLVDQAGHLVGEAQWETRTLAHNQPLTLRVAPQAASAGQRYTLEASGAGGNPFGLWGYSLNALSGELRLSGASSEAEALRLITRYELTPALALRAGAQQLARALPLALLALVVALMPGLLALLLVGRRLPLWDGAAWLAVALALGLALWPLLWYGLTLVGGRWAGWGLWLLAGAGWGLSGWLAWRARPRLRPPHWEHAALALILLGGLAVRLLAVRDQAFPPWVDPVRHALITTLMVEKGQVLFDYAPLLPIARFPYHFGFHVLPASLLLMTGWPLAETLLLLGQLLNALAALALYGATWLLTRRRVAGLIAAFLVAFPFLFPAYYATWGRFTQLTGMLVLPILIGVTWRIARGERRWRAGWPLLALLAAGLFLIHLRLFIYFLPFPLLAWVGHRGRGTVPLVAAGALGTLLVAHRLWYLWPRSSPGALLANNIEGYNEFPVGYLRAGWESGFLALGALALLAVGIALLRGRRWAAAPLALALWVAALLALLAGRRIGLPESWLVNLNSLYITFFFPLAALLAIVAGRGAQAARRWLAQPLAALPLAALPLAALLTLLLRFGIHQQITVLNEQTLLARPADQAALAWLATHSPAEARLLVSSWPWLGGTWSGSDGGAWLVPLTHRASTTPPADYIYNPTLAAEVVAFNERAAAVTDWSDPALALWLREAGVTHLFVGARGGFLEPAALARNPALTLLYQRDGTFIFALP